MTAPEDTMPPTTDQSEHMEEQHERIEEGTETGTKKSKLCPRARNLLLAALVLTLVGTVFVVTGTTGTFWIVIDQFHFGIFKSCKMYNTNCRWNYESSSPHNKDSVAWLYAMASVVYACLLVSLVCMFAVTYSKLQNKCTIAMVVITAKALLVTVTFLTVLMYMYMDQQLNNTFNTSWDKIVGIMMKYVGYGLYMTLLGWLLLVVALVLVTIISYGLIMRCKGDNQVKPE